MFPASYKEAVPFMFSYSGPQLLVLLLVFFLIARYLFGSFSIWEAVIFFTFIALRSFMEWGLHKYIFNADPLPLTRWRLISPISRMHQIHHEHPYQVEALFFGWKGVLAVVSGSWCALLFIFMDVSMALSGGAAVIINLLLYEWFHLLAHSNIVPRFKPFYEAVSNHRSHHFNDGRGSFSVSSAIADKLLGTFNKAC